MHLINLTHLPLIKRLQLEEALFRTERENYCLFSSGADPAIVMGISQKVEEVVESSAELPLLRRFSGGGTVVVGPGTDFVTFILSESCFPKEILSFCLTWMQKMVPPASLVENDYVIHDKKFAGNAQAISKGRFLQHSTLLWDFSEEEMATLKYPPKTPSYRKGRSHLEFLTKLKDHLERREGLFAALQKELQRKELDVEEILKRPHRKSVFEEMPAVRGQGPVLSTRYVID